MNDTTMPNFFEWGLYISKDPNWYDISYALEEAFNKGRALGYLEAPDDWWKHQDLHSEDEI